MFSDAISSILSRWRPSSSSIASAISGSVSASEAVKKPSSAALELCDTDMVAPGGEIGIFPAVIPPRAAIDTSAQAQGMDISADNALHLGIGRTLPKTPNSAWVIGQTTEFLGRDGFDVT